MIKLAIEAQLPLVAARTRDTVNLGGTLKFLTGKTPQIWAGSVAPNALLLHLVTEANKQILLPLEDLYSALTNASSTLVIVNPVKMLPAMFDAGEIPSPRDLLRQALAEILTNKERLDAAVRSLGGCTLKEAAEYARLTMARDRSLTPEGLMRTRKESFQGSQGLLQVDIDLPYYEPSLELFDWVEKEAPFFLGNPDPRLVPRGLLFDGPPGVGKTAAAKWLAQRLSVPLFRLDIAGTKNKFVGQSEANLMANLAQLDQEEPCIVLFDEVEKLLSTDTQDTSGTTTSMMSQLLWWMAERRSRVLVVMTTNNRKKLPPELYREGRVDRVFTFGGLTEAQAGTFAKMLLKTFDLTELSQPLTAHDLKAMVSTGLQSGALPGTNPPQVSHAAMTSAVMSVLKQHILKD